MPHNPSYQEIFHQRGDSYNLATQLCPEARHHERQLLLDLLDLEPHHHVCDIPAGGGYLAEGLVTSLDRPSQIICVEPSQEFMKAGNPKYQWIQATLTDVSLPSHHFDRIGSLAGLHHLDNKEAFFQETYRLLKPGGKLAVADVQQGSDVALYLNDAVDRLSDTGHDGMFFEPGALTSFMKNAGFTAVTEQFNTFSWIFPDLPTLVMYSKMIFGLHKATVEEVEAELRQVFSLERSPDEARLPWSLQYASGTKPLNSTTSTS